MTKKKQTDPITEKTDDFAGSGVEGTKGEEKQVVRGEDVLKTMRAAGVKI